MNEWRDVNVRLEITAKHRRLDIWSELVRSRKVNSGVIFDFLDTSRLSKQLICSEPKIVLTKVFERKVKHGSP